MPNPLLSFDDLKALLYSKLDVSDFLDIIGCDLAEVLDKFEHEIEENRDDLEHACGL